MAEAPTQCRGLRAYEARERGQASRQGIPSWDAVQDDDGVLVASRAEVAGTTYTALSSTRAPVTARLVVRRVRRLRATALGQPLDRQSHRRC